MSIHNGYLHEQGQLNQWLQHYGPYPQTNLLLRKREMLYKSPANFWEGSLMGPVLCLSCIGSHYSHEWVQGHGM